MAKTYYSKTYFQIGVVYIRVFVSGCFCVLYVHMCIFLCMQGIGVYFCVLNTEKERTLGTSLYLCHQSQLCDVKMNLNDVENHSSLKRVNKFSLVIFFLGDTYHMEPPLPPSFELHLRILSSEKLKIWPLTYAS